MTTTDLGRILGRLSTLILLLELSCTTGPAAPGPTRIVVDGLGRSVVVPAPPRRVVSLAPSVTEAIYDLGFGDRLVGISNFCRPPAGSPAVARVGGILNPSLETIRQLHPDLLIATTSGNDPSLSAQAQTLGVGLYTLDTPNVETALRALEALADLLGEAEKGRRLEIELRRRLDRVRERLASVPAVRVLYIVWGEPLIVPGRPAFLTDALREAGAVSVTGDAGAAWPAYDLESAIASAPDVIVTSERNRAMLRRIEHDPAWGRVPAVRSRRLLVVSGEIEQPGPQVVSGIEELARGLYPSAFHEQAGHEAETN